MRVGIGFAIIITAFAAAAQPQQGKELNERGLELLSRGDYPAAEKLFRQSMDIWTTLGPEFEAHLGISMMNLGDTLCVEGRWPEAATLFERSLEYTRRAFGPRELHTIANQNRLANVYLVTGDPARGEALYRELLPIERELYPNDLQTAHTLGGLASVQVRRGDVELALPDAEESLRITSASQGDSSTETGLAYANLGQVLRMAGHNDRALPMLRRAEVVLTRNLGPNHPRVASVISQEGLSLLNDGKMALAEQALTHAVDQLSKIPGANVELAGAEYNLGLLRMRQKKYSDADTVLTRALALEEQYASRPGREMATTLEMLSQVREKLHRFDDAEQLKRRASMITSYR